ncbi:MAG: hypothetical protein WAJ93_10245, partial [Candidatus Nitrosopolaris sp.]
SIRTTAATVAIRTTAATVAIRTTAATVAIHTTAATGTLHTITVVVPTTSVATPITKVTFTAATSSLRLLG